MWWLPAPGERWLPRLRARVRAGARVARGRSPVLAQRLRSLRRAVSVQHGGGQGPGAGSGGSSSFNNVQDARSIGVKSFEDNAISWYWNLIGLFIAVIVSLPFLVLLSFTAGVLFWIFILGMIGIIGYGIWHCYDHLKGIPGSDLPVYDIGFQRDFRVYLQLRQTRLAFMLGTSYVNLTELNWIETSFKQPA